jgi:cap2 methyltransferase
MLIYNIPCQGKLPGVSRWLSPDYNGEEDVMHRATVANLPCNWKTDFADYVYGYEPLLLLKHKLNAEKNRINPIRSNPDSDRKYDSISDAVRFHDALRGRHGMLVEHYGAEIVTNAWLKMFELMIFLHDTLEKLQTSKRSKKFCSLHIAEAPGNFMLAINHKIKTQYPSVDWEWLANSYKELYNREDGGYLRDQYGLIRKHPTRWIFGADGDGDITSVDNINSFAQDVQMKFEGQLHLITSDVKYVPKNVNFDEEENINTPVHLGHLLSSLVTLSKDGTMILKQFTVFESQSVCLLYLMSHCFKKLRIVKPETSRPANSEMYVVGTGYKNNLSTFQKDKLMNIMRYIRFLNTEAGSPCIFRKEDVPEEFVEQIIKIQTKLTDIQIQHLQRNLQLYETYKDSDIDEIRRDFASQRDKAARVWIEKNNVMPLDDQDRMSQPDHNPSWNRGRGRGRGGSRGRFPFKRFN